MAGAIACRVEGGTSKEPAGLTSVSPWVSRQSEHRPLRKRCNPKRAGKAGAQFFCPRSSFASPLGRLGRPSRPPDAPTGLRQSQRSALGECGHVVTLYGAQRRTPRHAQASFDPPIDCGSMACDPVDPATTHGTSLALRSAGSTGPTWSQSIRFKPRDGF